MIVASKHSSCLCYDNHKGVSSLLQESYFLNKTSANAPTESEVAPWDHYSIIVRRKQEVRLQNLCIGRGESYFYEQKNRKLQSAFGQRGDTLSVLLRIVRRTGMHYPHISCRCIGRGAYIRLGNRGEKALQPLQQVRKLGHRCDV